MSDPYAAALGLADPAPAPPVAAARSGPSASDWAAASAAQRFDSNSSAIAAQEVAQAKTPADRAAALKTQAYTQAKIAQQAGVHTSPAANDPYADGLGLDASGKPKAQTAAPAVPAPPEQTGFSGWLARQNADSSTPGAGILQAGAHALTGAGASMYGLTRGIGAAAGTYLHGGSGNDALNSAVSEIQDAQQKYTYDPPDGSAGATLLKGAAVPLGLLSSATGSLGDKTLAATGSPLLATVADVGTNALATAGAGKLLGRVSTPKPSTLADLTRPPRVEPTMDSAAPVSPASPGAAPGVPVANNPSPTLPQAVPGMPPSSAQATAAPTLADASPELQQAVAAAGDAANPQSVARHVEADTLPVPVRLTAGQAAQDPAMISNEMNSRGKGQAAPVPPEFYQAQGQALAKNMEAVRASVAPDVPTDATLVDHGQTLIDAYKAKAAAADANTSALYKQLSDANGGSLPLNGQDFVSAADAALKQQMKGRYVPPAIAGDLEDFRAGGPMTFEDFENLRTNLAAEGRKAERAGDGNAAAAVNIVRNSLEQMPMTNEASAVKPLADAARGAARAQFQALRADPAYKAAANDSVPMGEPSPLADKFFQSYVTKGARANVATMAQNLGDNPIAKQTIAAGTVDQLKGALKADPVTGNFSQDAYNKAVAGISPKIDSLLPPETAQQVRAIGNVAKNAQTQPRGSYVNNSNSATSLLAEGAKSALEHGTNMLFGGLPVGTVTRKVGGAVSNTLGQNKASANAIKPGAGITSTLSGLTGKEP